jgi:hypothetical protein
MAILLNGVMSDFKESEKVPGELESAFSAILAFVTLQSKLKKYLPLAALQALHVMVHTAARLVDGTIDFETASKQMRAA